MLQQHSRSAEASIRNESAQGGLSTIKRKISKGNFPFWVSLALLIVAWELWGGSVDPLILVPPSDIIERGLELIKDGSLLEDILASGTAYIMGFTGGAIAGIAIGVLTGVSRMATRIFDPYVSALYAVPIIAFSPLFIIALGLGIASKVVVVAFVTVFPMIFVTSAGVRSTESSFKELGRSFNLTRSQAISKILLPSSVPFILSGLRVATGRSLSGVLAAELFGARDGVGLMILSAASKFDTAAIYVGIAVFAIAGILITGMFYALERKLAPWRQTTT